MIVRISNEGQYEIAETDVAELNQLDNAAVSACASADETQFRAAYGALLTFVRGSGTMIGDEQLTGSDVILPPPDVSLQEASSEFTGDGLIPG